MSTGGYRIIKKIMNTNIVFSWREHDSTLQIRHLRGVPRPPRTHLKCARVHSSITGLAQDHIGGMELVQSTPRQDTSKKDKLIHVDILGQNAFVIVQGLTTLDDE